MNAAFPKVLMQHFHSESNRKFVKMGQMLSWMLTIVPLYLLQLPLNVGGLGAVRSGGNSALVLHSMVSLCNVVVCCISMRGDLEETVSSAGSVFTVWVNLIRGPGVPGM